jgi:hypothetical protein
MSVRKQCGTTQRNVHLLQSPDSPSFRKLNLVKLLIDSECVTIRRLSQISSIIHLSVLDSLLYSINFNIYYDMIRI